jgi:hypothetical protein
VDGPPPAEAGLGGTPPGAADAKLVGLHSDVDAAHATL